MLLLLLLLLLLVVLLLLTTACWPRFELDSGGNQEEQQGEQEQAIRG